MRRIKTGTAVLLMLAVICGLVGCGQGNVPEVSSVSMRGTDLLRWRKKEWQNIVRTTEPAALRWGK